MVKRRTIGNNPLDAVVPLPKEETESAQKDLVEKKPEKKGKQRLTIHLPVELIDRVKNAVYWSPGLTLAGLAERALAKELRSLEKENGVPFKKRIEELRGGRPLK